MRLWLLLYTYLAKRGHGFTIVKSKDIRKASSQVYLARTLRVSVCAGSDAEVFLDGFYLCFGLLSAAVVVVGTVHCAFDFDVEFDLRLGSAGAY